MKKFVRLTVGNKSVKFYKNNFTYADGTKIEFYSCINLSDNASALQYLDSRVGVLLQKIVLCSGEVNWEARYWTGVNILLLGSKMELTSVGNTKQEALDGLNEVVKKINDGFIPKEAEVNYISPTD